MYTQPADSTSATPVHKYIHNRVRRFVYVVHITNQINSTNVYTIQQCIQQLYTILLFENTPYILCMVIVYKYSHWETMDVYII